MSVRHGAGTMGDARVARSPQLARIDAAVARSGWRSLGVTRLVPLSPFNLQLLRLHFLPRWVSRWGARAAGDPRSELRWCADSVGWE